VARSLIQSLEGTSTSERTGPGLMRAVCGESKDHVSAVHF
jgi:hypothetical protein